MTYGLNWLLRRLDQESFLTLQYNLVFFTQDPLKSGKGEVINIKLEIFHAGGEGEGGPSSTCRTWAKLNLGAQHRQGIGIGSARPGQVPFSN